MNIIEAVESGLRFKRLGGDRWLTKDKVVLLEADVKANDWITEPQSVSVTRDILTKIWSDLNAGDITKGSKLNEVLVALGLK